MIHTFNVTSEISFGLIKALWYLTTLISNTKPNRKTEATTQQWHEWTLRPSAAISSQVFKVLKFKVFKILEVLDAFTGYKKKKKKKKSKKVNTKDQKGHMVGT